MFEIKQNTNSKNTKVYEEVRNCKTLTIKWFLTFAGEMT